MERCAYKRSVVRIIDQGAECQESLCQEGFRVISLFFAESRQPFAVPVPGDIPGHCWRRFIVAAAENRFRQHCRGFFRNARCDQFPECRVVLKRTAPGDLDYSFPIQRRLGQKILGHLANLLLSPESDCGRPRLFGFRIMESFAVRSARW